MMKTVKHVRLLAGLSAAAFAALFGTGAWAQAAASAPSRAEVKQETRDAAKSGKLTPAGEGGMEKQSVTGSTRTRSERKAETLEARKKGELKPAGQALYEGNMSQQKAMTKSTKTRAERKAETQQAAKEKKLTPAGEAAEPAKK